MKILGLFSRQRVLEVHDFLSNPLQPFAVGMRKLGVETVPPRHHVSLSTSQHQANFGDQHDKGERHEDK